MKQSSVILILIFTSLFVVNKASAQFNPIEEYIIEGEFKQALSLLNIKSMFGDTSETYSFRGLIFVRTGKTEEGFEQWDKALEENPNYKYLINLFKSGAYEMLGDEIKAKEYLNLAKQTCKSKNGFNDEQLVLLHLMYGKIDDALKLYEKIISSKPKPQYYNEMATVLLIAKRKEEAFNAYRNSYKLDHSEKSIFKNDELIHAFFINVDKYEELNAKYEEEIRTKQKNNHQIYFEWGNALATFDWLSGRDKKEVEDELFYDQLSLFSFHNPKILDCAKHWLSLKKKEIVSIYNKATELKPKKAEYHYALAKAISATRENDEMVIEEFDKACNLAPKNKDYFKVQILYLARKSYYNQAEEKLTVLKNKFPEEATLVDSMFVQINKSKELDMKYYLKEKEELLNDPYKGLNHPFFWMKLLMLKYSDKEFFDKELEEYKQLLITIKNSGKLNSNSDSFSHAIDNMIKKLIDKEPE
ncbi:hypothetical protein [Bacteroides sp. 519]|uniref:tetratricopeptide repeat protein n=1 Tax=Bacteroides sp. 519 TaxID=2302937 RepID=UPI0013D747DB|nr:hypothetical protein [Bacteroides sp. 519]NDV57517.1 hypothetical protein [Bacteroides sp. 519]